MKTQEWNILMFVACLVTGSLAGVCLFAIHAEAVTFPKDEARNIFVAAHVTALIVSLFGCGRTLSASVMRGLDD